MLTVRTFGQLTDITGGPFVTIDPVADTDALQTLLHHLYPGLRHIKYIIAVDKKTIPANTTLTPLSEVALLPPFSGG